MMSSLGFHTLTLLLSLKAHEVISLVLDFFQYSHDSGHIKIEMVSDDGKTKRTRSLHIPEDHDGYFPLPLETIITYRQDIGIKWRIVSKRSNPDFNSYTVEVKINPKLLSGISDYLTAATIADMDVAISNFNEEAKRISPILQDFSCYKLGRVDYCVNFSLQELAPNCTPYQVMSLIKRSNTPPSYREWVQYDAVSHRYKSKPSSFYLMNGSVHINCYSKFMQLQEQSKENAEKGYPPIAPEVLNRARDLIRFEIQCKYHKAYSMSQIATCAGNINTNKYESLLAQTQCIDQISAYYRKSIGNGDWYTLQEAVTKIENQNFNSQREQRLVEALRLVNHCRSVPTAIASYHGHEQATFKQTLKELSSIGINPVTIPKEWGIKHIPNLLYSYFDKADSEKLSKDIEQFQSECVQEFIASL